MAQTRSLDHARLAKLGFLLGLGMFVVGAGGELVAHAVLGGIPAWEEAILFDLEVVGLLVGFFSPILFAIVLPLVE